MTPGRLAGLANPRLAAQPRRNPDHSREIGQSSWPISAKSIARNTRHHKTRGTKTLTCATGNIIFWHGCRKIITARCS